MAEWAGLVARPLAVLGAGGCYPSGRRLTAPWKRLGKGREIWVVAVKGPRIVGCVVGSLRDTLQGRTVLPNFPPQLTAKQELLRTRGIRLFN